MAKPRTTHPIPNADHWNSGSLPQRALYAMFEQVMHAAGARAGRSGTAKQLADTVLGKLGGATSALATGGATVAASTMLNADFFAAALANKFGLPRDRVTELANDGLETNIHEEAQTDHSYAR